MFSAGGAPTCPDRSARRDIRLHRPIYLILTLLLTLAIFHDRPVDSARALASILVGIPFYFGWQAGRRLLDASRRIFKLSSRE